MHVPTIHGKTGQEFEKARMGTWREGGDGE